MWSCNLFNSLFFVLLKLGSLHELIEGLNHAEDNECNDQEVDDCADECTKVNAVLGARNWNRKTRNLGATARDQLNKWVDDVIDKGGNNSGKCAANDDTNSHVHNIALLDKLFKLLDKLFHFIPFV